jgi:DNA (cytosine-5)-methyltransferase 1
MGRQDYETETLIAHSLRAEGFDASEDGTGRGTPLVPVGFAQNQRDELRTMDVAGALAAEPGMKQQTYIAFSAKDHGADAQDNLSPTLRAGGHSRNHTPMQG